MGSVDSDENLFERFRSEGDVAALGALFDRVAPALLRVALHLARDPNEAEDLVQATFLRAIEARGDWDGARAVLPWLLGILHNRVRHARRRAERRADPERLDLRPPLDPSIAAERAEFDAAVDMAIAELPAIYRPVLRLHLAYGHAPAEIAHALELPPATVRSQLARGLERLRRILPRSFAGLAIAGLCGGRGLAAVKATVLERASAAVPAPLASELSGGVLVTKAKGLSIAAALALLGAGSWFVRSTPGTARATVETVGTNPTDVQDAARQTAPLREELERTAQRVAVDRSNAPTTGALHLTCRWDDGSPAPGVLVTLGASGSPFDDLVQRSARTGADGMLRFDELPAGPVQIAAERGGWLTAAVVAGAIAEAELVIPAGILLRGRVVDRQGAPVPRAAIWLSIARNVFDQGQLVATADAGGRFELRSVEPERFVSASAAGLRAAPVQPVRGEIGDVVELELVIAGPGATLAGTVFDPEGRVVSGARVLVGEPDRSNMLWNPTIHGDHRPAIDAVTDEHGMFRVDGLEPGARVPMWVRANGSCAWSQRVEIAESGETDLRVELARGARIEGRVTDAAGDPIRGAAVVVYCPASWVPESWDVRLVLRPTWARDGAVTDGQGRYAIEHVPPGAIRISAASQGHEARGRLDARDGSTIAWNPVLADGVIRGRVLGPDGAPLAGVAVGCIPPADRGSPSSMTTGADGRFDCVALSAEPHVLRFWAADDALRARPAATLRRVLPGEEELTVRLTDALFPTASICGRLLDAEGRPPAGAEVCFSTYGVEEISAVVDPETGRFELRPLPGGTYRAQPRWGEPMRFAAWSEPFELRPREQRDLGVLALEALGSVAVRVMGPHGEPIDGAQVALEHDSGWSAFFAGGVETADGRARIAEVAPGRYRVALCGDAEWPYVFAPVAVRSNEESEVELRVPPSVPCRIVLMPPSEPLPLHETITWTREGEFQERWRNFWESASELDLTRRLVPGSWEVEIESESGAREVARFRVDLTDTAMHTVRIRLP